MDPLVDDHRHFLHDTIRPKDDFSLTSDDTDFRMDHASFVNLDFPTEKTILTYYTCWMDVQDCWTLDSAILESGQVRSLTDEKVWTLFIYRPMYACLFRRSEKECGWVSKDGRERPRHKGQLGVIC